MTSVTLAVALIALTSTAADARRYHHPQTHQSAHARHGMAWCGLYMRQQVGGDPGPDCNLARSWARWGTPSSPSVGAVVVWSHHDGIIVGEQNGQWIMRSGNDGGRVRTRPLSTRGVIAIRRGGGSYAGAYASARHDQAHTTERRAQRPVTRATREVALYDRQDERSAERFNERADDRFAQNYASVARQRDRRVGYRHARYLSARGVRRVSQREQTIDVPHATSPVACDGSMRRVDQPDRYLSAGLRPQRPRAYR